MHLAQCGECILHLFAFDGVLRSIHIDGHWDHRAGIVIDNARHFAAVAMVLVNPNRARFAAVVDDIPHIYAVVVEVISHFAVDDIRGVFFTERQDIADVLAIRYFDRTIYIVVG